MKLKNLLLLLVPFLLLMACEKETEMVEEEQETETTVGMLQHVVYFYLNEDVTEERKAEFEEGLVKLLSIEEVFFYEIGTPGDTPEREVTDHTFAYSISAWFKSMEDYEVYADHPVHMQFVEDYSDIWAEVKVYDSEVIAEK